MSGPLPPAPTEVVCADGDIAFGTYAGHTGPVEWARAARSRSLGLGRRPRQPKRWHYVSVAGPDILVAVAVVDVGWASSAFAYCFDRVGRHMRAEVAAIRPHRAAVVSPAPADSAETAFRSSQLFVRLRRDPAVASWRLEARSRSLTVDATLTESTAAPTMCAIAPVPGGVADCTHKTPALSAVGLVGTGAGAWRSELSGCFGSLDHTSGLLARDTSWRWASATDGTTALNLTEGFTAPAENVLWHRGELRTIGPVEFHFDRDRPDAPWRISGDGCDLTFRPEGVRAQHSNLVLAKSIYVQPVGAFSGTIGGIDVDRLPGVTEDHVARW